MSYSECAPVGTVVAFAGPKNKVPANWLICDGALYDRAQFIPNVNAKYQVLFDAIGASWGGEGANKFAVPDLQGLFLRGVSEGSNADVDKEARDKSRPDLNSSGNGGNAVGSKQLDELKSHTHPVSPNDAFMDNDIGPNSVDGGGDVNYGRSGIRVGVTGGSETRPKNAYVYYIIKAA